MSSITIENFAPAAIKISGENIHEIIESSSKAVIDAPCESVLTVSPAGGKTSALFLGKSHSNSNLRYYWFIGPVLALTLSSKIRVGNKNRHLRITKANYSFVAFILLSVYLCDNSFPESCGYCKRSDRKIVQSAFAVCLVPLCLFSLALVPGCIYGLFADFLAIWFPVLALCACCVLLTVSLGKAMRRLIDISENTPSAAAELKPIVIHAIKGRFIRFSEVE